MFADAFNTPTFVWLILSPLEPALTDVLVLPDDTEADIPELFTSNPILDDPFVNEAFMSPLVMFKFPFACPACALSSTEELVTLHEALF